MPEYSSFKVQIAHHQDCGCCVILNDISTNETMYYVFHPEHQWVAGRLDDTGDLEFVGLELATTNIERLTRTIIDDLKNNVYDPDEAACQLFKSGLTLCLLTYLNEMADANDDGSVARAVSKTMQTKPENIIKRMQELAQTDIDLLGICNVKLKTVIHQEPIGENVND